jgi:hypothetical protein
VKHFTLLVWLPLHCFFIPTSSLCQDLRPDCMINQQAESVYTDMLENIYLLKGSTLAKYSASCNKLSDYKSTQYGNISYADVQDPMRILLYFQDFNQILFLDNYLAPLGDPVSLDALGVSSNIAVCSSVQGGYWIFDITRGRLVKYDRTLNPVFQNNTLQSTVEGTNHPVHLTERNNYVYITVEDKGVYFFDRFGNFISFAPLAIAKHQINFREEQMEYFVNDTLYAMDHGGQILSKKAFPPGKNSEQVIPEDNRILVQYQNAVHLYKKNRTDLK